MNLSKCGKRNWQQNRWPPATGLWWETKLSSTVALLRGLLPDTQSWRLRMRRECRERFHRCRLQRKPLVSDPGMHHGTCVTHVPWCMSGLLTRGGEENVPGIPGACATRNFTYLVRGPCAIGYLSLATQIMPIRCLSYWKVLHICRPTQE